MIERGHGRIVNVSSMGTRSAALRVGAYAASKAALESWTEGLMLDLLGTGVRAQLLVPGTTKTEFSAPTPDNEPPFPPDPNAQDPEEVAAGLLALLRSDDFEGFASAAHAATSHAKRSDPNGFLAAVREHLTPSAPGEGEPGEGEPDEGTRFPARGTLRGSSGRGDRCRFGHREGDGNQVRVRGRRGRLPRRQRGGRRRHRGGDRRRRWEGAGLGARRHRRGGQVDRVIAAVADELGRPSVLANIAGIGKFARSEEQPVEEFRKIIEVNLIGAFAVSRACLPHLLETRGNIVNVSSSAGIFGQPYNAAYCASKGGVSLMTKAMATEYTRRGVRVNAVAPAGIDTPIANDFAFVEGTDLREYAKMMPPTGEMGTPEMVASLMAYLASDEASYINGTIVPIDMGVTA